MSSPSVFNPRDIRCLWALFDVQARWRFAVILALNLVAALLEVMGAGLIVSFVTIIANSDYIFTQAALRWVYASSSMNSATEFQIAAALALLIFYAVKNIYLAAVACFQYSVIYKEMRRASERMLASYLSRPYEFHIATNSSILIRNVGNEVLMFFSNVIMPLLTVFAEVAVVLAMAGLLLWLSPAPALIAIAVLGGVAVVFFLSVRQKVRRFGVLQQAEQGERIKSINQGLGGIKEIKVLGRESYFVEAFAAHERVFSEATRYAMILNQMPRLFMETVAFSALFVFVVATLSSGFSTAEFLPMVALFAMAALRLMPSANRILGSVTRISYHWPAVQVVYADARPQQKTPPKKSNHKDITFAKEISLRNITYRYPGAGRHSLHGVDCTIPKGASVALVGPSGAGKTTLADIILGLLTPSSGQVLVDGQDVAQALSSWQRRLGYIPQTIFLCDESVRRNVAFGVPDNEINEDLVWLALERAQLKVDVQAMPDGLDTVVGEQGISLSGGQRQRVGIARALYHDPDVLVFDEATSALDGDTEREVSRAIDALVGRKTIIIIAHRPATIEKCLLKIQLRNGRIVQ